MKVRRSINAYLRQLTRRRLISNECRHFFPLVRLENLVGATGLEPAASCVTGRRSNQLNYAPANLRSMTSLLSVSFHALYAL
jgi:hypothetical protein